MMAQDYNIFLAASVLNEHQLVNYRNLSRTLKVHSNRAKQMLFEFHRKQNSKRPGSVHATYLLTGVKSTLASSNLQKDEDGDAVMQSSPWLPSSPPALPEDEPESIQVKSIMLVREEHLEKAKSLFESISSVHIYSLHNRGLSQTTTLTECNRRVRANFASEDPLVEWKTYGVIQNANVRRRTTKGPPPAAPVAAAPVKPIAKTTATEGAQPAAAKPPTEPLKNGTPSIIKPAAGKGQNSALFKSFAKSSAKPKKPELSNASNSQNSSGQTPAEDERTGQFSDDDDEQDDASLPEELADVRAPSDGNSRKQREAELHAMMDQEDEDQEMKDVDVEIHDVDVPVQETVEAQPTAQDDDPSKADVETVNGRRRGRRRIMKKKTVRDEEGYLVTKEEPAWESFSEDEEPATKKAKVQPPSKPAGTTTTKKGGTGKASGNIMSFFAKK